MAKQNWVSWKFVCCPWVLQAPINSVFSSFSSFSSGYFSPRRSCSELPVNGKHVDKEMFLFFFWGQSGGGVADRYSEKFASAHVDGEPATLSS